MTKVAFPKIPVTGEENRLLQSVQDGNDVFLSGAGRGLQALPGESMRLKLSANLMGQERGQPCPRVRAMGHSSRGHGCPRSWPTVSIAAPENPEIPNRCKTVRR